MYVCDCDSGACKCVLMLHTWTLNRIHNRTDEVVVFLPRPTAYGQSVRGCGLNSSLPIDWTTFIRCRGFRISMPAIGILFSTYSRYRIRDADWSEHSDVRPTWMQFVRPIVRAGERNSTNIMQFNVPTTLGDVVDDDDNAGG